MMPWFSPRPRRRRSPRPRKHGDFLRDFRGDTIHPSTLEIMHELGFLEEFLKRPHQEVRELRGEVGSESFTLADFSHLPPTANSWPSCRNGTF